jgi:hypothetical protein
MGKVYKAVVVYPGGIEDTVVETAKNIKAFIRKLEVRNYKVKKVLGEM